MENQPETSSECVFPGCCRPFPECCPGCYRPSPEPPCIYVKGEDGALIEVPAYATDLYRNASFWSGSVGDIPSADTETLEAALASFVDWTEDSNAPASFPSGNPTVPAVPAATSTAASSGSQDLFPSPPASPGASLDDGTDVIGVIHDYSLDDINNAGTARPLEAPGSPIQFQPPRASTPTFNRTNMMCSPSEDDSWGSWDDALAAQMEGMENPPPYSSSSEEDDTHPGDDVFHEVSVEVTHRSIGVQTGWTLEEFAAGHLNPYKRPRLD